MARHPRNDDTDPDSGFVSRWSRRKQQAREREQGVTHPDVREETPDDDPAAAEVETQLPEKTDADMPPIESISDTSNVEDFFSPGVSEQLRTLALRKLFRGAKFNIRDGLDDYDDDFRNFAALGDIVTADMKHQQELAKEREQQELAEKEKTTSADVTAETVEEDEERAAAEQIPSDEEQAEDQDDSMAVGEAEQSEKEESSV